jgi:hypothetical protein
MTNWRSDTVFTDLEVDNKGRAILARFQGVCRRGMSYPRGLLRRTLPSGRWVWRGSVVSLLAAALLVLPAAGGAAAHRHPAARLTSKRQ